LAPELITFLDDTEAFKFILDFLKVSLLQPSDQEEEDALQKKNEGWVRNQAMQSFGEIIHAVYLRKPD